MKLRRILVENIRSFLSAQELRVPGNLSIIIGPNGGGKTNLLDTVTTALRRFLLKSWIARPSGPQNQMERFDWITNESLNNSLFERHSQGVGKPQRIEIDLEMTASDLESIKKLKLQAAEMASKSGQRYSSCPITRASGWEVDSLVAGQVFTYKITDDSLQGAESKEAKIFQEYLEFYEIDSRLRADLEISQLSTPMISLPVNRSANGIQTSISLATFNEHALKQSVDAASSRATGSIMQLAIGRLAGRYRILLGKDNGKAKSIFTEDPTIAAFTKMLRSLGYEWELVCVNDFKNEFDIRLSKQGSSFLVGAASSGERELLNYLFAIYALNVRDALIVVDEPELHLHPRWQRVLLALFEKLADETGNQFLMATHSPVFVSPKSIEYVSRVSSEKQQSRVVRLGDQGLPNAKHLFNIVNGQNNEKIFFADHVVLVEGQSDRMVFEKILAHFGSGESVGGITEVVSVGGKGIFPAYEALLKACGVPFSIIADLDYIAQVGSSELKGMFHVDGKSIAKKIVDDPTSVDATTLMERMEEASRLSDFAKLTPIWEYIKQRQRRLRSDLSAEELGKVDAFIQEQRASGLFLLSKGSLERYLPAECSSKDTEKLIKFISSGNVWNALSNEAKTELELIATAIIGRVKGV